MSIIKSLHLPSDFLLAIYHWGQVCHATPFPESARTVESAAQKKPQPAPLKGSFHGIPPLHFSQRFQWKTGKSSRNEVKQGAQRMPRMFELKKKDTEFWQVYRKSSEWPSLTGEDFADVWKWEDLLCSSGCYLMLFTRNGFCSPHKHLETHENPLKPLMFDSLCRRSWDSKTM